MVEFRNLVVFMSDGVRWDYHPDAVREMGVTVRTLASSLHTPTSIASLLTGLYLPNHGVRGFTDSLPKGTPTILDAFEHTGISAESGNFNNEIYNYLLDRYDRVDLQDIEEPFGWFMRDPGGHAPLNEFDEELATTGSVRSYLKQNAGDESQLREDYARAVDSSVNRFRNRVINTLRDRGILEDTLIVFISDHGEFLGEYGHVCESHPAAPELVRVPTTLIHPGLDNVDTPNLMRHVDLHETVADLGSLTAPNTDGGPVFDPVFDAKTGLNFYDRPYPSFSGTFHYTLSSVWDWQGGRVFNESNPWARLKLLGGYLTKIPAGIQVRRARNPKGIKLLLSGQYSIGNPGFSAKEARKMLDDITVSVGRDELDMDQATKENLEDLGYL
ncbi:sulfatase-like hydrolase/transferase [Halobacterium bonnevillei]|uniref:Sulfatase-like hydrolase/transferase n=1 Tax=Halobacterium bonnevillei TaxID=2692200 RepID=A0A6B0SPB6_9EURY|nr:sulfatase-like hydrolase/transferase [Halobacterium bonnevillei]MXR19469.1 sulfatase-like hydrolase/transferase [Halobacterium bonnevillei]